MRRNFNFSLKRSAFVLNLVSTYVPTCYPPPLGVPTSFYLQNNLGMFEIKIIGITLSPHTHCVLHDTVEYPYIYICSIRRYIVHIISARGVCVLSRTNEQTMPDIGKLVDLAAEGR
jgi:hypothetical protein